MLRSRKSSSVDWMEHSVLRGGGILKRDSGWSGSYSLRPSGASVICLTTPVTYVQGVGVGTWVPCFCCTGLVLLVTLGCVVLTPLLGPVSGLGGASFSCSTRRDKRSGALKGE